MAAQIPLNNNRIDLNLLQWNCRSLKKNLSEFKTMITNNNKIYDIIALQETWRKPKQDTPNFGPYDVIRDDRIDRAGGGIMLLIRNTIQYLKKPLILYPQGKLQVHAISIKTDSGFLDVLNVYNPRQILSKREFNHYLQQLRQQYIIVGDFNAHHSLWEPSKTRQPNQCGRVVSDILTEDTNRIALATPPGLHTHTNTRTAEKSTIDLSFCNPALIPLTMIRSTACSGSDHMPISIKIMINIEKAVRGKRKKNIFEQDKWKSWK